MARVTEFGRTMHPRWIWDITDKVGWGLTNRRGDVQLVQLSINKVGAKVRLADFRKRDPHAPAGFGAASFMRLAPLTVDGYMGNETANAINSYIRHVGTTNDQTIDPVHPLAGGTGSGDPAGPGMINLVTKIQKRTMFRLNADHLRHYGKLMDELEFPEPLKSEIRNAKR